MLQEPRLTQLTATKHPVNVVYHVHDLLLDHIRVFLKESDVKASIILMDHVTYSTYCVSCALFDIMFIIFHWIELEVKTNCCSLHNHLVDSSLLLNMKEYKTSNQPLCHSPSVLTTLLCCTTKQGEWTYCVTETCSDSNHQSVSLPTGIMCITAWNMFNTNCGRTKTRTSQQDIIMITSPAYKWITIVKWQ